MNEKDPGLAPSRNSGGSRAANADDAPFKHAGFHSSRPLDRKALPRAKDVILRCEPSSASLEG
jgi:hypothetical protein